MQSQSQSQSQDQYDVMKQTIEKRLSESNQAVVGSRSTRALSRTMNTNQDWALTVARIGLGLVMFPHGAQKALGWFGGSGLRGTAKEFKEHMGLPEPVGHYAAGAEFLGSLGLITGLFTRVAALGIISTMVGAIQQVHLPKGFFMNWYGKKEGEGYEYHILAITLAAVLLLKGGGAFSMDRWLQNRKSALA